MVWPSQAKTSEILQIFNEKWKPQGAVCGGAGEHAVSNNQKHTGIGGDAFNDWMNLAGRLNQSDRWRDATASLASIFLQIGGTIKSVVTTGPIMKTCCGTLIRPFNFINFTQPIDYCCYKNRFSEDRGQQQSKETLVRGDVAAVMEVKNTRVIKVKERKRDWLPLLSLVILMSSLTSQRVISPESRLCLPLKASFLFRMLFVVFLR